VEILTPPEGSKPGDVVEVEGFLRKPDPLLNPKKKIFETCAPGWKLNSIFKDYQIFNLFLILDLKVNGDRLATFRSVPWTVNGKHVLSQTLVNVQIK